MLTVLLTCLNLATGYDFESYQKNLMYEWFNTRPAITVEYTIEAADATVAEPVVETTEETLYSEPEVETTDIETVLASVEESEETLYSEDAEEITTPACVLSESPMQYLGEYKITWYCHCEECNGGWYNYPTASGTDYAAGYTIATSDDIAFGSTLYLKGYGYYCVQDRGVQHGCVDIYVNDHNEIPEYGVDYTSVYLVYE